MDCTGLFEDCDETSLVEVEVKAHRMYDAYCKAVGGLAFNGDPLPHSSEFFKDKTKTKQANAWRKVAEGESWLTFSKRKSSEVD